MKVIDIDVCGFLDYIISALRGRKAPELTDEGHKEMEEFFKNGLKWDCSWKEGETSIDKNEEEAIHRNTFLNLVNNPNKINTDVLYRIKGKLPDFRVTLSELMNL